MNSNVEKHADQAAWDVFGTELLPGDEIVIDNITGETILKENLERYLTESKNYHFCTVR
jgi:hypothetical protein